MQPAFSINICQGQVIDVTQMIVDISTGKTGGVCKHYKAPDFCK